MATSKKAPGPEARTTEPTRSIEIETKLELAATVRCPNWVAASGWPPSGCAP